VQSHAYQPNRGGAISGLAGQSSTKSGSRCAAHFAAEPRTNPRLTAFDIIAHDPSAVATGWLAHRLQPLHEACRAGVSSTVPTKRLPGQVIAGPDQPVLANVILVA